MEEQNERARKYLAKLVEVGKEHGFSLSHEDGHGSFIVESRAAGETHNDAWLLAAFDQSGGEP